MPGHLARKQMLLRAYPFHIEIVADNQVIASHPRTYARQQEILDPLHYLALVEERPRRFRARPALAPLARPMAPGL